MKRLIAVTIFIVSFLAGFLLVSQTYAADGGTRWISNSATMKSYTTNYNTFVINTRNDYHDNTDLYIYMTPSDPEIILVQGDYGYQAGWQAFGQSWSIYGPCADFWTANNTGLCNTTNAKSVSGTIYINSGQGYIPYNERDWVVRHELGHILGMGHEANRCTTSVMSFCNLSSLKPFDINLINNWY